jgi:hypothetical protein
LLAFRRQAWFPLLSGRILPAAEEPLSHAAQGKTLDHRVVAAERSQASQKLGKEKAASADPNADMAWVRASR